MGALGCIPCRSAGGTVFTLLFDEGKHAASYSYQGRGWGAPESSAPSLPPAGRGSGSRARADGAEGRRSAEHGWAAVEADAVV